MRTGLMAAALLAASIPTMAGIREMGDDIFFSNGDDDMEVKNNRPTRELAEEVTRDQLRRRGLSPEQKPDPVVQAAAEAKRARKAARLKDWAAKGAIGIHVAAVDPEPVKVTPKKRAAPKPKEVKAVADAVTKAEKKAPAKRKTAAKKTA